MPLRRDAGGGGPGAASPARRGSAGSPRGRPRSPPPLRRLGRSRARPRSVRPCRGCRRFVRYRGGGRAQWSRLERVLPIPGDVGAVPSAVHGWTDGWTGGKWGSGLKQKERRKARFGGAGLCLGARLASAKWRRANPIDLRGNQMGCCCAWILFGGC